MPLVTATPKGQSNGQVVTEFIDSVGTTSVTYNYPKTQEALRIRNTGSAPVTATSVGTTQLIQPGDTWERAAKFTSFSIVSSIGNQSFEAWADEKGVSIDIPVGKYLDSIGASNDSFPVYLASLQPSSTEIMADSLDPDEYIKKLWEPLRQANPKYISRNLLGKDQSNTYDIWSYVFSPESYERTVIIGATAHGWEVVGQKILFRMMKLICEQSNTHPMLKYLRNKVRFVIIPVQNPWGVVNADRLNSRAVDLNRNYDYRWSVFTPPDPSEYKGTAAASESETQLMTNLFAQYANEGATVHFDIHNTSPQLNGGYFVAMPYYSDTAKNTIYQVIRTLKPTAKINNQYNMKPLACNYSSKNFNMHSLVFEWIPSGLGDVANSAEDITSGVNFFTNTVYHFAILPPPNIHKLNSPTVLDVHHSTATLSISNTAYTEIAAYTLTLDPLTSGILEVDGIFTIHNTTTGAICYLSCSVEQSANDVINASTVATQQTLNEVYGEFNGLRGTLPLGTAVRVYASKDSVQTGPVIIRFYARANVASAINFRRTHIRARFTPTDTSNNFIKLSAFNSDVLVQDIPKADY